MSFDVVKADLSRMYPRDPDSEQISARLTIEDMQRWAALKDTPQEVLCDEIGLYLAQGFHNLELTYYFCDGIVNDICGLITSWHSPWPDLFWTVYLAFDEGEYYHNNDQDQDPVELYTKPQIAQIVADHLQSSEQRPDYVDPT